MTNLFLQAEGPNPVVYQPAPQPPCPPEPPIQYGCWVPLAASAPAPVAVPIPASLPAPAPQNPDLVCWIGSTRAEVDAKNAAIEAAHRPTLAPQLVPYKPDPAQQFWCRELNGVWSLRTCDDIMKNAQPGDWRDSKSGYPVFYRKA